MWWCCSYLNLNVCLLIIFCVLMVEIIPMLRYDILMLRYNIPHIVADERIKKKKKSHNCKIVKLKLFGKFE